MDTALMAQIKATENDRTGGMATAGTVADPHGMLFTGDAAQAGRAVSAMRLASLPATTEKLNQSSNDVTTHAVYKVCHCPAVAMVACAQ